MDGKYNICSRSGRIRMDSDGERLTLRQFVTTTFGEVTKTVVAMEMTVEEFKDIAWAVLETAANQLSATDIDLVAEAVVKRIKELVDEG